MIASTPSAGSSLPRLPSKTPLLPPEHPDHDLALRADTPPASSVVASGNPTLVNRPIPQNTTPPGSTRTSRSSRPASARSTTSSIASSHGVAIDSRPTSRPTSAKSSANLAAFLTPASVAPALAAVGRDAQQKMTSLKNKVSRRSSSRGRGSTLSKTTTTGIDPLPQTIDRDSLSLSEVASTNSIGTTAPQPRHPKNGGAITSKNASLSSVTSNTATITTMTINADGAPSSSTTTTTTTTTTSSSSSSSIMSLAAVGRSSAAGGSGSTPSLEMDEDSIQHHASSRGNGPTLTDKLSVSTSKNTSTVGRKTSEDKTRTKAKISDDSSPQQQKSKSASPTSTYSLPPPTTADGIQATKSLTSVAEGSSNTSPVTALDDVHVSIIDMAISAKPIRENFEFHKMFPIVPPDERLVEDYVGALNRDGLLIQGRMYISEHHLCFKGWSANSLICCGFGEIVRIDKKNVALLIPNSILVETLHSKYFFASLLSRDSTYDLLVTLWNMHQPTNTEALKMRAMKHPERFPNVIVDSADDISLKGNEDAATLDDNKEFNEASDSNPLRMAVKAQAASDFNAGRNASESTSSSATVSSGVRLMQHSNSNEKRSDSNSTEQISNPSLGMPISGGVGSKQRLLHSGAGHRRQKSSQVRRRERILAAKLSKQIDEGNVDELRIVTSTGVPLRNWTESEHGKLSLIVTRVFDIDLEHLWVLVFSNYPFKHDENNSDKNSKSFSDNFLQTKSDATNIVRGPWREKDIESEPMVSSPYPVESGGYSLSGKDIKAGLHRKIQYTMPLNVPMGPKMVDCKVEEKILWANPNEICMETEARTPDAPSGGSFYVVTRSFFQRLPHAGTKLEVYSQTVFTKSSWIRMAIEKGCYDGQKTHFNALVQVIDDWMTENKNIVSDYQKSTSLTGSVDLAEEPSRGRNISRDDSVSSIPEAGFDKPEVINYSPPLLEPVSSSSSLSRSPSTATKKEKKTRSLDRLLSRQPSMSSGQQSSNSSGKKDQSVLSTLLDVSIGEPLRRIRTHDEQSPPGVQGFIKGIFGRKSVGTVDDTANPNANRSSSPGALMSALRQRNGATTPTGSTRSRNITAPQSAYPIIGDISLPSSPLAPSSSKATHAPQSPRGVMGPRYKGVAKIDSFSSLWNIFVDLIDIRTSPTGLVALVSIIALLGTIFASIMLMMLQWRVASAVRASEQRIDSLTRSVETLANAIAHAYGVPPLPNNQPPGS